MRLTSVSYLLIACLFINACTGGPGSGSASSDSSGGSASGGSADGGTGVSGGTTGGGTGDTPGTTTPDTSGPSGGSSGGTTSGNGGGGSVITPIDTSVSPTSNGRAVDSFSGTATEDGYAQVRVAVENATAIQMLTTANGTLASLALADPANKTLLDATKNSPPTTYGLAFDSLVNSLPYPTRSADDVLRTGNYLQTLGFAAGRLVFAGSVVSKNDSDLTRGTIRAKIFLVGDEAQRTSTRTALDAAVAIWQQVYAGLGAGVTVQVSYKNVSSNTGIIPNPTAGNQMFLTETSASDVAAYSVPVFVGDDISSDGTSIPGNSAGLLGVSAGIPGPALPTSKSAVAISLVNHAGADGVFSDSDVSLLGETLAHEVGHYLGLVHPVECKTSSCVTFQEGDALSDTANCTSTASCVSSGTASNLMFPVPVSGQSQRSVSSQQGGVVNLQVLVD